MYLVWASFFKVGFFILINFVTNLFFMEIDFCNAWFWISISVLLALLMEDIYQGLNWISSKNNQIKNLCVSFLFLIKVIFFVNIRLRWWWILKYVRDYQELRKIVWIWYGKITWDRTWSMNIWENIINKSFGSSTGSGWLNDTC